MASVMASKVMRKSLVQNATRSFSSSTSLPAYILNAPATECTTLGNGLRVASEGGHDDTATVGVWIDAGSRYETEQNNGVAHFLEHMAFKGTSNRSQHQLEVEIENMGGHLNAYTSREQTVYYAKVFKDDVPQAMEILSDILQNATFDEQAINRERDVILREMEEVEKQPEEVIFDRLHETAFQDTGLGRTILGPVKNIRSITRDHLKDYIATHYTAPRVVVAGAGAVEHAQLTELSEKYFGNLPAGNPEDQTSLTKSSSPAFFTGSDIRLRDDSQPLAHVALAVESAGWTSPHAFPLMVMQTLLGCWDRTHASGANMASSLCQNVAENDCAHSIMSFNTCYKDTGLFGVYAVAEDKQLNNLMFNVMEAMVQLSYRTTEEEVARARNNLKATMLSQLDGSSPICEDIGRQLLTYGRRMTPAEVFARIDAVDAAAVKAAASTFIVDQDIALAASGPIFELPDYNWLRRRSFHLRS